jgi:hypothetical protein
VGKKETNHYLLIRNLLASRSTPDFKWQLFLFFWAFFFMILRIWTHGLVLGRQVPYLLSHTLVFFALVYFSGRICDPSISASLAAGITDV